MPRIEILHGRDPDGGCDITVFLDGERVSHSEITVDPGRGHTREDWDESLEFVRADQGLSVGFRMAAVAELEEASDSPYIV